MKITIKTDLIWFSDIIHRYEGRGWITGGWFKNPDGTQIHETVSFATEDEAKAYVARAKGGEGRA